MRVDTTLGSPTHKWKDLYISDNTIYFYDDETGRTKMSVENGTIRVVSLDESNNEIIDTEQILFSPWTEIGVGGAIQFSDGNVGIGTGENEVTYELEVIGDVKATMFIGDGSSLTNIPAGPEGPQGPQGGSRA